MEMTKEELLAKAKRDYPVGTIYNLPTNMAYEGKHQGKPFTVESNWFTYGIYDNIHPGSERISDDPVDGCVYYCGQWAEIISKPNATELPYSLDLNHFLDEVWKERKGKTIANVPFYSLEIQLEAHKRFYAYQLEHKDKELAEARENIERLVGYKYRKIEDTKKFVEIVNFLNYPGKNQRAKDKINRIKEIIHHRP